MFSYVRARFSESKERRVGQMAKVGAKTNRREWQIPACVGMRARRVLCASYIVGRPPAKSLLERMLTRDAMSTRWERSLVVVQKFLPASKFEDLMRFREGYRPCAPHIGEVSWDPRVYLRRWKYPGSSVLVASRWVKVQSRKTHKK
jgi:hypothetical protein